VAAKRSSGQVCLHHTSFGAIAARKIFRGDLSYALQIRYISIYKSAQILA